MAEPRCGAVPFGVPLDAALESRLSALIARAAHDAAAEELVRGYGGEIYSFLRATLGDPADADDAFAMFSEHVWRGLAGFKGDAAFRTWAYQIARNAARMLARADGRRRRRFDDGGTSAAERVAWEVRSSTAPFRRSEVKSKLRALRDALRPEERELLVLRVDRELEWAEVARILGEDPATLRKRFERIKEKLRAHAQRAGLLGGDAVES